MRRIECYVACWILVWLWGGSSLIASDGWYASPSSYGYELALAEGPTAQELYERGMNQYVQGDFAGAMQTFRKIDAMQLPREQRVALYEAIQDINRRVQSETDPDKLLREAGKALDRGRLERAVSLYESVINHPRATEEQVETAKAHGAEAKRQLNAALTQSRQKIDEAQADIEAGRFQEARLKLENVQQSGVDLGWFDRERVDRYLAAVAERRSRANGRAAAKPTILAAGTPQPVTHEREPQPKPQLAAETAPIEPAGDEHADDPDDAEPAPDREPGPAPKPEIAAADTPVQQDLVDDLLTRARMLRAQEKAAQARMAERNNQYHLAVKLYEESLALDPTNDEVRLALGAAQLKADQENTAASVLQAQLESRRLRGKASIAEFEQLLQRGTTLLEAGNYSAAREAVQQAKFTLDLSQQYVPSVQFRELRQRAVDLAAQIAEAERVAEEQRIRDQEIARKQEAEERRRKVLMEQQAEVQRLLKRAMDFRREQKYDQALELLDQVLAPTLDPNNFAAQAMKETIEESRLFVEARRRMRERDLMVVETSNDNVVSSTPYNDLLMYPPDWPQLSSTRLAGLDKLSDDSEVNRQVSQKLRESVPISFDENKLDDVIKYLRNTTGLNFFVNWPVLEAVGVEKDLPISLQLTNVAVEQALKLVLQQASASSNAFEDDPVSFSIIEGIVHVSTESDLSRTTDTRPYDIRDLLVQVPSFDDAPQFDLASALEDAAEGGSADVFEQREEEARSRQEHIEQLQSLIRDTIGKPQDWDAGGIGGSSVRELNGTLIVRTTPRNHRQLAQLLRQLRETRALQIAVEGRFLLVDQNFLEEVGVDIDVTFLEDSDGRISHPDVTASQDSISLAEREGSRLTPAAFLPDGATGAITRSLDFSGTFTYLDDLEVNVLIQATQASRRAITLTAPRLTLMNGQRSYVIVARQIAFVSDLEPIPDAAGFDPTLSVTQSGVILDVEATVGADRRYVTMTVRPSLASLLRIRELPQTVLTDVGVTDPDDPENVILIPLTAAIEAPEIQLTTIKTSVNVPDQGTLLLGGQRLVSDIEVEAGVPVLSKIPVINRFFTNTSTTKDEQTLLVLIKPTIIIQSEEEEELFPGLLQNPQKYNVGQKFGD